jgi:hypothetical protein
VLGHWTFFFYFKGPPSWILQKNVLQPLEPKLSVMWEKIGEALKMMFRQRSATLLQNVMTLHFIVEASATRGTTALVYSLINSSLYTGTVQRW